jgi:hypothetical protein
MSPQIPIDPVIRRRNRILLIILLAVIVAIAAGGLLYLQKYGFAVNKEQNLYH